jgi:hypothetical protein
MQPINNTITPLKSNKPYPKFNPDNVLIFDDMFPPYLQDEHEVQMLMYHWEYGHFTDHTKPYDKFFGRQMFHRAQGGSQAQTPPFINNLTSLLSSVICHLIDPDAQYLGLYRISANGQTPGMIAGVHVDTKERNGFWTAVYMVNDGDGDLVFYDENNIEKDRAVFKKGRLVVFPSGYMHEALPPTNTKWRVTIGIMFEISTNKHLND